MRLRNAAFDLGLLREYDCPVPVICVGNVTAGGSGKSPLAHMLAEELLRRGSKPVILSRGYGGKLPGPHIVTSADTAEAVGDESLMHRVLLDRVSPEGGASVVIAKRRAVGARFIAESNLGDVIILDDGFQHRWLARDLNLLLLDDSNATRRNLWRNGKLLPEGRLRESLSSALRRTDAVVLVQRGTITQTTTSTDCKDIFVGKKHQPVPCFELSLSPSHFSDLFSEEEVSLDSFATQRGVAVTAIAYPESFFGLLEECGILLEQKHSFLDHHLFSWQDWESIRGQANSDCGLIFTTAKDAVKVKPFVKESGTVFVLNLKPRISNPAEPREKTSQNSVPDGKAAFFSLIEKKLGSS